MLQGAERSHDVAPGPGTKKAAPAAAAQRPKGHSRVAQQLAEAKAKADQKQRAKEEALQAAVSGRKPTPSSHSAAGKRNGSDNS